MAIVNPQSGTRVDEVEERIYRISTPATKLPGGFSFNQYLIVDDAPLLFHTGPRKLFPFVLDAVGRVLPVGRLRWIAFSHFEADECGSLNEFLAAAPGAVPLCGAVAAMVSVNDVADREWRALADGEVVSLGRREVQWLDTPHMPHAWECGTLFERTTRTLLVQRSFHRRRSRSPGGHRGRHPRAERAFSGADGLLLACEERAADTDASRRDPAGLAGPHARQRLAG